MTPLRRIASPALSLLLVFTLVAAGPTTGAASADTKISADCDIGDAAVGIMNVVNPEDSCGIYNNKDEELSSQSAYANARGMSQIHDSYSTLRTNGQQDLEGQLWMKGKAAAIESLQNGGNASDMQSAFNSTVDNYTARMVKNDLKLISAESTQLSYLAAQTGAGNNSVGSNVDATTRTWTAVYRLPNGEWLSVEHPITVSGSGYVGYVAGPEAHVDNIDNQVLGGISAWKPGRTSWNDSRSDYNPSDHTLYQYDNMGVLPIDATESPPIGQNSYPTGIAKVVPMDATAQDITRYMRAGRQIKANGAQWSTKAHSAVEAGAIEPADLWDPVTLATEASTQYNKTGYFAFKSAELSALGLTGDTNVSHIVETRITQANYNPADGPGGNATYTETTYNATIEGTLFIGGESGDMSLQTGQTYDPATLTGTVYMSVASAKDSNGDPIKGANGTITIDNPFTITEATNTQTGEAVQTTTAEEKDYDTTNITQFRQEIERLKAERRALEEQRSSWGGGGSNPTDDQPKQSGLNPAALALILAGVVVLGLLLQRGDRE